MKSTNRWILLAATCAFASGALGAPQAASPKNEAAAQAAASADSAQLRAFKKAIRARYDLKEKAFAAHDADTIVTQFYARDVISVGEGEGIFIGRDAIRPLYQEVVKDNQVKIQSKHTFVDGNAGWDWVDFHVLPSKDKPFTFAMLFLWAKIDGRWVCKGDFFVNGSFETGKLTAPTPPPAK
jgi:ketosteroid isomerase-like protein